MSSVAASAASMLEKGGGVDFKGRGVVRARALIGGRLLSALLVMPGAVDAQQLATVQVDRPRASTGETITVTAVIQSPSPQAVSADLYAGVLLPDHRTLVLLTPSGEVVADLSQPTGFRPFATGVNVTASVFVAFSMQAPATVLPSQYTAFVVALVAGALSDGVVEPGDVIAQGTTAVHVETLRSAAERVGLRIGAAVQHAPITLDPMYEDVLGAQLSVVVTEDVGKFPSPTPGTFTHGPFDTLVALAERHRMAVHGHALVHHRQLPEWLTSGSWSRDELIDILRTYIVTVVERYRGRVASWDVLNEVVGDDGQLRPSIWLEGIGPGYIAMAFRWAHEADPGARLCLNEYGLEWDGRKAKAVRRLVMELRALGVPVDCIGLQMHVDPWWAPSTLDLSTSLSRFASLGVEVRISEMDVRLPLPTTPLTLDLQAGVYADALRACLAVDACTHFVMWGFTDRFSWIPAHYPGFGAALLFDGSYAPKPAYHAVIDVLREAAGE